MQRYEKYKYSGIDWLGEIPEHWEVKKFPKLFSLGKGLSITKADLNEYGGIPCVSYGEIHSKYGFELNPEKHSLKFVDDIYLKTNPNSLMERGDFAFADTSEDISGSGNFTFLNSDIPVFSGYHTVLARPIQKYESKFLAFQLESNSLRNQIRHKVKGVKVFSITQSILKELQLCIPPLHEQESIAKFLDDKCAKIDTAVGLKQQQIEKLKELRQITIHNVVTKGIRNTEGHGSAVPIKDSGIEWIGEIPAHWEVKRLKNLFYLTGGGTPTKENSSFWNGKIPWVSPKDMKTILIEKTEDYVSEEAIKKSATKLVSKDSLLIVVRSGILQRTIPLCFANVDLTINQDIKAITAKSDVGSKFLYYYILGLEPFLLKEWVKDGATVESIEVSYLLNTKLLIPPISEQKEIVIYLKDQTSKIDVAISQKQEQIVKLKEYKQSLINDVVTGKIKVF